MNLSYNYIYFFLAVISFLILYRNEKLEIFVKNHKLTNKLILLISLIFSFYLWGPNLQAKWGLTDDHLVMHYFIDNPKVSLLEVPKIIAEKTEVGKFGDTTINRPFYYAGRVIESVLWQRNVSLWYLARIIMFGVAVALFWLLAGKWLGIFYGGIFIFAIFTAAYWPWIWGYLGPAENYAMFGSALYLFGFYGIFSKLNQKAAQKKLLIPSLLLLSGALIAIGSKENFLILAIPAIYLAFLLYKNKIYSRSLVICLSLIFIYSAYIATGIYLGLLKAGGDVYGRSVGIPERLELVYADFLRTFISTNPAWVATVICFGLIAVVMTKTQATRRQFETIIKKFLVASGIIILLYLSQVFFYNSSFPPGTLRYSFPGMLALPLQGMLIVVTLFSLLGLTDINKFILKQIKNAVFVGLLVFILIDGYQTAKLFVKNNVDTTNAFSKKMTSFYNHLEENPQEPVVFDAYSVWNVEPIASIRAYLLANDIKNPMFLRLNFPRPEVTNDLVALRIFDFLNHISNEGGCGFTGAQYAFVSGGDCTQWGFKPVSKLSGHYFTIEIDEQNRLYGHN